MLHHGSIVFRGSAAHRLGGSRSPTEAKLEIPQIPRDEYDRISQEIASAESPVGIDAKKTHVIILHKLNEIEKRLEQIERRLGS